MKLRLSFTYAYKTASSYWRQEHLRWPVIKKSECKNWYYKPVGKNRMFVIFNDINKTRALDNSENVLSYGPAIIELTTVH